MAAHDAITSPLLDNISILGAKGVLINITGGSDLTIDEVTDISAMIAEEAGDEAEIIFGTVLDSAMEEEIRVTLIATGFDDGVERRAASPVVRPTFAPRAAESEYEEPVIRKAVGDSSPAGRRAEPARVPRRQPIQAVAAGGGGPAGLESPFPPVSSAAAGPAQPGLGQPRPPRARSPEDRSASAPKPASVVIRARGGGASELELPTFIRR